MRHSSSSRTEPLDIPTNYHLEDGRQQRLSHSSSVHDRDEQWNRRLSRLSAAPSWHANDYVHAQPETNEFINVALDTPHEQDEERVKTVDPAALEKAFTLEAQSFEVSRDLASRNFCIFALVLGIAVGITSLAVGCEIVTSGKVLLPNFLRGKYVLRSCARSAVG